MYLLWLQLTVTSVSDSLHLFIIVLFIVQSIQPQKLVKG